MYKTEAKYHVSMEVAGPLAMFARPDTGVSPTSYPVPPWSAAKGIFEAIAFLADGAAWVCPTATELCREVGQTGGRVYYQRYTTNYGGPLRKASLLSKGATKGGSSMQLFAAVLSNVCYRLHGVVVRGSWRKENDPRHHLKDLFDRRLRRGQCFRTPCLGWSEFTCSYWGPFREGVTERDTASTIEIPSMLFSVWDQGYSGNYGPVFNSDAGVTSGASRPGVVNGLIEYDLPQEWVQAG